MKNIKDIAEELQKAYELPPEDTKITITESDGKLTIYKNSKGEYDERLKKNKRALKYAIIFAILFVIIIAFRVLSGRLLTESNVIFLIFLVCLPFGIAKLYQESYNERYKRCDEKLEISGKNAICVHILDGAETYIREIHNIQQIAYKDKNTLKDEMQVEKNTISSIFNRQKYKDEFFDFNRPVEIVSETGKLYFGYGIDKKEASKIILAINKFIS